MTPVVVAGENCVVETGKVGWGAGDLDSLHLNSRGLSVACSRINHKSSGVYSWLLVQETRYNLLVRMKKVRGCVHSFTHAPCLFATRCECYHGNVLYNCILVAKGAP